MKSDRASALCGRDSEYLKVARKKGIDLTYAEAERKTQAYKVDLEIRELKKYCHHKMVEKKAPKRLWDFCLRHAAKVRQFLPRNNLHGRTAMESVTGKTPDISEYLDFDFYDLCWYYTETHPSISKDNRALCRWLGVSHRIGSDMCYWIITETGIPMAETTVQHVTRDDLLDQDIKVQIDNFNEAV